MFAVIVYVSEQTHELLEQALGGLWATSDMRFFTKPFFVLNADILCIETLSGVHNDARAKLIGNSAPEHGTCL